MKSVIMNNGLFLLFSQETNDDNVKLVFDIFPNISPTYQLSSLNEFLKKVQTKFNVTDLLNELENEHDNYLEMVQQFVLTNTQLDGISDEQKSIINKVMTDIIYLLVALETNYALTNGIETSLKKGLLIDVKTQIPIGAGLGSSAAFGVCVAAIFYIYTLTHSQPNFVKTFIETATDEERQFLNDTVSSWAFLSERIMHGTPSGLDNTVCTYGSIVQFIKNPKRINNIALKTNINILLVNTGISRNTSAIVRKVRELKDNHTSLIDCILNAMGALVEDVVQVRTDFNKINITNKLSTPSVRIIHHLKSIIFVSLIVMRSNDC